MMICFWSVFMITLIIIQKLLSDSKIELNNSCYSLNLIIDIKFSLILISGHMIQDVPEFPLVVSDKIQEYSKTKQAVAFLRLIRAWNDIQKVINHFKKRAIFNF